MPTPSWAETYIDKINGSGFYFKNWPQYSNPNTPYLYYPWGDYSWYSVNTFNPSGNTNGTVMFNLTGLNITSENNVYTVTFVISSVYTNFPSDGVYYSQARVQKSNTLLIANGNATLPITYTFTGTIENLIKDVADHFKNIDIIVDGDYWSRVSPLTYQWQSVPSISGKNGILQPLSTLVNINDGNPVSGASASDVNIIPASVVSGMIQTGASDVIVSFEIPQLTSGTYDSIKLVGKRGGIPRSKTDGEFIETLSDSDTSKTLTGLTKGYTYWFVIFAEDSKGSSSESDPYPYETGEGESIAFFEIDLGQGGKDIVRYDASKSIGSHKQGELYGNYSIANDELSTNGYIYWDYDATENPKSIPADCCLYFEYDTLFTGNEGYLDWYVLDANNDQQIYWCYDTQYAFLSNRWYNCLVVAEVKNGYIKRYKYVLDGIEISHDTANIKMPCTDAEGSIGISEIYFHTTRSTKIKNMSIYYDFSTYTEAGGGGGGGSGASGSNSVS